MLRLSAIGDVTHVVPVVRTLQRQWPQTKLTWIIGKTEAAFLEGLPGVELIVFDKSEGLASYRKLGSQLKGRRFDVLLHMQISLRASLAGLLVKAPLRVGFDRSRAKNGQWIFTNRRIEANPRQHVLDGFMEFAKSLGISNPAVEWNLPIPEAARVKVKEWVGEKPFMVINPSSSVRARNWRNWDGESYARIAEYAAERYGLRTVLTGGPSPQEAGFAESISHLAGVDVLNLAGKTNLKELLALLERAVLVIAPDTGPAHMANAVGTPVIGLYASSNPNRTGPYTFRHLTVNRYPEAVLKEFGKKVEEIPWGRRVRDPGVMSLISVKDVTGKIDEVFTRINSIPNHHDPC